MLSINFPTSMIILLCILVPLFFFVFGKLKTCRSNPPGSTNNKLPKPYPIIGHLFAILENKDRFAQWSSEVVTSTPNLTFCLICTYAHKYIVTANPANVQHVLKSRFHNYVKGDFFKTSLRDLLGNGIFNVDGESWKFQRKVPSHEFNTKSVRIFILRVVDAEISDRLLPILKSAADKQTVLDFQDILQRLAFDNICTIAFGHDPEYLLPSLPQEEFSLAFQSAVSLSTERFLSIIPDFWKVKRALNVGSEKQLKIAVEKIRKVAKDIMSRKKHQLVDSLGGDDEDLLSRFLASGNSDEDFVADIVISFILAGKDSTSAALTWFFWLISNHPKVEAEILREIDEVKASETTSSAYDQLKDMVYTHASLCESMRLYPPVPMDVKEAVNDDVLPDGTIVKKGTRVIYHPYAMGRVEKAWGRDWAEFRPQRWLETTTEGKWKFVEKDAFTYPVFQAGPRICLGKEMAFIQMKRVVAAILPLFRVVPVLASEPVYMSDLISKMKGGFEVRIETRD